MLSSNSIGSSGEGPHLLLIQVVCPRGVWEGSWRGVGGVQGRKASMVYTPLGKQSMSIHVIKGQRVFCHLV